MFNHEAADYRCPFGALLCAERDEHLATTDLVVPVGHVENRYGRAPWAAALRDRLAIAEEAGGRR